MQTKTAGRQGIIQMGVSIMFSSFSHPGKMTPGDPWKSPEKLRFGLSGSEPAKWTSHGRGKLAGHPGDSIYRMCKLQRSSKQSLIYRNSGKKYHFFFIESFRMVTVIYIHIYVYIHVIYPQIFAIYDCSECLYHQSSDFVARSCHPF